MLFRKDASEDPPIDAEVVHEPVPVDGDEAEKPHEPEIPEPEPEPEPEYTIDDLAATTGIPSRTIRFYQSSGALQKPAKRGRVAYYGPAHIERLALIGKLQDRGLRMRAIKEVVERIDRGELALDEWLGLEGELQSSWTDDAPKVVSRADLEATIGDRRPGFLAELLRLDLVEAREGDTYLIPSPGLLRVALELDDADVELAVATKATKGLRKHLERAAGELADLFVDELGGGQRETVRRLRPVAQEWVQLIFAREMERTLRQRVESGAAATGGKRPRSKWRR